MEEGGDQTSPAVQQIRAGKDPDIGPPATHRAETELERGQTRGRPRTGTGSGKRLSGTRKGLQGEMELLTT